ncbi:MAG: hypothetical protein WBF36_07885, partial [Desulfobulbales bacterium]
YYIARWEHLNLFSSFSSKDFKLSHPMEQKAGPAEEVAEIFMNSPTKLLDTMQNEGIEPLKEIL